ncbi:hypothetical protein JB92DRAFT_3128151 [Gautieria morchelliformis]|nr:hypothetical protein JB92DRAFT_3128151 [Gautieria morchelliformis]
MHPIPPATFSSVPISAPGLEAVVDPALLGNATNTSCPSGTAASALPLASPLRSTLDSMASKARKFCEEFSTKETHEEEKKGAKEVQNALEATKKRSRSLSDLDSDSGSSTSALESGSVTSSVICVNMSREIARMVQIMERHEGREASKEEELKEFRMSLLARHDWVIEMQDRVVQMQEHTSNALLDILRQGLLN